MRVIHESVRATRLVSSEGVGPPVPGDSAAGLASLGVFTMLLCRQPRPLGCWGTPLAVLLLCIVSQARVSFAGAGDPLRIDTGLIRGETLDAEQHLQVYRGIPYAAPPVGELRWQAPQRAATWQGVRDCLEFSAVCPQQDTLALLMGEALPEGSEDCLYLNVWTAAKSADAEAAIN
jgi:hypothetical protein